MQEPGRTSSHRPAGSFRRYAWLIALVALALAIWGIVGRVRARSALATEAVVAAVPVVATIKPSLSPPTEELVLPGTVQAFFEAPIYARTSGYLKIWYTDIGTQVKKGQLLAEIDTPEVDQELGQAEADLATARANAELARTTNERWQHLLATHSVSQQDADSRAGDWAAKQAAEQSARANVARLRDLESFKRVTAPFDGVVTQRNTDIGALINAGESTGAALFRVADTSRLRIYALVPEPYAASMQPGVAATLRFTEHPDRAFAATLVRTANALDPSLRTLQVELQVDNTDRALFPGAYAEVHFQITGKDSTLRLPANALLFRSAGLQVAVVDSDNHVRLKSIMLGRDFGTAVEVLSGIAANDRVVINPPDSLIDGEPVHVAAPSESSATPARRAT